MTMRDRWENLKKNVEENQVVKKTKGHISRHKTTYIVGGSCLVAGVIGGHLLTRGPSTVQNVDLSRRFGFCWKPVDASTSNNTIFQIAPTGHRGNKIWDPDTKEMWPSVRDAAKNLGVMPSTVRDNLAGKNTPILGDRHLVNLGENLDGIRP